MVQCNRCNKKALIAMGWGNYKKNYGLKPINYCPECNKNLENLIAKTIGAITAADAITKQQNFNYHHERKKEMERLLQPYEQELHVAVQNGFDITLIRVFLIPYLREYNVSMLDI